MSSTCRDGGPASLQHDGIKNADEDMPTESTPTPISMPLLSTTTDFPIEKRRRSLQTEKRRGKGRRKQAWLRPENPMLTLSTREIFCPCVSAENDAFRRYMLGVSFSMCVNICL